MRKQLVYISAITLLILASMQIASAKTNKAKTKPSETTDKTVVEELLDEVKNKPKTAINQDMYLKLYKEINNDPKDRATKTISKKYSMTEDQIRSIVVNGDLSQLIKKQENADISKILFQYTKILNDYNNELETENLRSELELQTKPSEIFMDGDTSNSEFDILRDLTVIEVILFNESSTSEFGGKFTTPDFDFSDKEDEAFTDDLFDKNNNTNETPGSQTNNQTSSVEFSPLYCFSKQSVLDNAISDFDESQQRNQNGDDKSGNNNNEDGNKDEPEFPKAESDEWPSKYLCPDGAFYCIDISFDIKSAKAYGKSDNCIACHVQNINKALDKLLSKPLSANKLSGNLFEVPKCKSSFTNLPVNMNIITVAVAPPRQSNQDKYIKLNIEKDWNKLKEAFNAYFYKTKNPPPQATVENRSIKETLQGASNNATIDEITVKAQDRTQIIRKKVEKNVTESKEETTTELNNTQYQMTSGELEAMNQAFNTILKQLNKMKIPCTDLSTKPYCS